MSQTAIRPVPKLPPEGLTESRAILKALASAHRYLAELKGVASSIPNQSILIDTLTLQEAKASSEIENIVTTQDELFQATLFPEGPDSAAAKEVALYRDSLRLGYSRLIQTGGLITNNTLIDMFQLLKRRSGGFRNTPGTVLRNDVTGETAFVPPQDGNEIVVHMSSLERFVNDDEANALIRARYRNGYTLPSV